MFNKENSYWERVSSAKKLWDKRKQIEEDEENMKTIGGNKEKRYSLSDGKANKGALDYLKKNAKILSDNKFIRFCQEHTGEIGLGALLSAGLGYGGYKLYKHYKDKKRGEEENNNK